MHEFTRDKTNAAAAHILDDSAPWWVVIRVDRKKRAVQDGKKIQGWVRHSHTPFWNIFV